MKFSAKPTELWRWEVALQSPEMEGPKDSGAQGGKND